MKDSISSEDREITNLPHSTLLVEKEVDSDCIFSKVCVITPIYPDISPYFISKPSSSCISSLPIPRFRSFSSFSALASPFPTALINDDSFSLSFIPSFASFASFASTKQKESIHTDLLFDNLFNPHSLSSSVTPTPIPMKNDMYCSSFLFITSFPFDCSFIGGNDLSLHIDDIEIPALREISSQYLNLKLDLKSNLNENRAQHEMNYFLHSLSSHYQEENEKEQSHVLIYSLLFPPPSSSISSSSIPTLLPLTNAFSLFPAPSLSSIFPLHLSSSSSSSSSTTYRSYPQPSSSNLSHPNLGCLHQHHLRNSELLSYGTSLSTRYYLPITIAPWPTSTTTADYEMDKNMCDNSTLFIHLFNTYVLSSIQFISLLPKTMKLTVFFGTYHQRFTSLLNEIQFQYEWISQLIHNNNNKQLKGIGFEQVSVGKQYNGKNSETIQSSSHDQSTNQQVHEKSTTSITISYPHSTASPTIISTTHHSNNKPEEVFLKLSSSSISSSSSSSSSSSLLIQPLLTKLENFALPYFHYLQHQSLLPSSSSFISLSSDGLVYFCFVCSWICNL